MISVDLVGGPKDGLTYSLTYEGTRRIVFPRRVFADVFAQVFYERGEDGRYYYAGEESDKEAIEAKRERDKWSAEHQRHGVGEASG